MSKYRTNFLRQVCPNLPFCVFIQTKAKALFSDLEEYSFFHRLQEELNLEIFMYDDVSFLQFGILTL